MIRLLGVFFVWVVLAGVLGCRENAHVVISPAARTEISVRVEVANTPAKRAQGLQYRNQLAEHQGMLFVFPSARQLSFWMKNTPLSLDLIFIRSDLRIVGIVERATPFSMEPLSVPQPSQFVLEVNGGFCQRNGVNVGDAVRFEGISLDGVKD